MCCSNHVMGSLSDDDTSEGPSLFADGSTGREYADAVWRGEEGISPSSAGDHPRIERPKHLCVSQTIRGLAVSLRMTRASSGLVVESEVKTNLSNFLYKKHVPEEDELGSIRHDHEPRHPNLAAPPSAQLPRDRPWGPSVTIVLALWKSNYYRWSVLYLGLLPPGPEKPQWQLPQVYLRYQDPPLRRIATSHSKSTIVHSLGMVSLAAMCTQRNSQETRSR